MKIVHKLWSAAGLPCRECGGRGYVVDSGVAKFIAKNGLAAFQAADTLMMNEIHYGALGSIPVDTWQELGLPEDEAELFATEIGHVHKIHACRVCKGQADHPNPLQTATEIISTLRANDRRRWDKWAENLTPRQLREHSRARMRGRMDVAIRYAQQPPLGYADEPRQQEDGL